MPGAKKKHGKIRVGLLFGGKSGEHEVSLQSAKSIYEALDKNKYEVLLIGIDKQGTWRLGAASNYLLNSGDPKLIALNKRAPVVTAVAKPADGAAAETRLISPASGDAHGKVDVFFPIIHGTYGEDGSLQGLLEMLDVPYVGAGVLGSAAGMDKDVMKRLLRDAGLPIGKFFAFTRAEAKPRALAAATRTLKFPVFVKPANMGSSVGISKAHDKRELTAAVKEAFRYDTKIILEEFIPGREIEVAVLGNDRPWASVPGEILPSHEFYSYEAKYIDENGAAVEIPARLSRRDTAQVRDLAVRVFRALECSGMGRVDFFFTPRGRFVVNEINTLPGFTKISMYPKLWEATGVPYPHLLDRLIKLALERQTKKSRLKRSFN
jgi:D-alanine-D-alanine ligase